jgi:DNA-binding NtrC family response regulator
VPLAVASASPGKGPGRDGNGVGQLVAGLPDPLDLPAVMDAVEDALVQRALAAAGGVQAEAARRLGVSRSHLAYKLKVRGGGKPPR